MVNLVIMRHGDAEPQNSQDSQRQLTKRGNADVSRMAQWLQQTYPGFEYIVCSPYIRAQQTAQLMLAAQKTSPQFLQISDLVPDGDCQQVKLYVDALLAESPAARILLVSHMPLVSFMVECFTQAGCTPIFETSALFCIDYQPGKGGQLLEKMTVAEL